MRQVTRKGLITVVAASGALALSGGAAFADAEAEGAATGSPGVLSGNNVQVPVHVPVNACGNTVNVAGALNPAIGNTCVNDSGGHGPDGGGHDGGHHDGGHQDGGNGDGGNGDGGHQDGGNGDGGHQDGGNGDGGHHGGGHHGGGGAVAEGEAVGSPGVGSGNHVQAPVDVPVNACGNSVNVIGLLNPAIGNECVNDSGPGQHPEHPHPEQPEEPEEPQGPKSPEKPDSEQPSAETPGDETAPQGGERPQLAQTGGPSAITTVIPAGGAMLLGGYVLYRRARVGQN
ncbi:MULTISPECIES: chaplin [unclassified Streptomyces]|uniref:chaplin n=1 Tax=unclassified Streptomyces TaxID=2593676 RepID=UPI0022B68A65|nr:MULTISPECIES: chaplin [unclassified Streptomyces]MCZ7413435.1 chaplin [Streptomyces sp. WMMC897]MCZ7430429.1 chaplin [Streptomyces sp. WMMC1477]